MYRLEHNKLPKLCNNNFVKMTNYHKYGTRRATISNYFLPSVGKNIAQNQLSFTGSKLRRTIKIQIKNKQWDSFTKQCIQSLLKSYWKICKQIAIALVLICNYLHCVTWAYLFAVKTAFISL